MPRKPRDETDFSAELDKLPDSILIDTGKAAVLLGVKPNTLDHWRVKRNPPPFVKMGRNGPVRYEMKVIREFIRQRTYDSTAQASSAYGAFMAGLAVSSKTPMWSPQSVPFLSGSARKLSPVTIESMDRFLASLYDPATTVEFLSWENSFEREWESAEELRNTLARYKADLQMKSKFIDEKLASM